MYCWIAERVSKRLARNVLFFIGLLVIGGCYNEKWEYEVKESVELNAWLDADGNIVLTRGMLELCETCDEVASIIAHEMAHKILRHSGMPTPDKEMEADKIGVELMAKAGYDPNAAVKFWTRYYEHIGWWEGDGTHQEPHERVETLGRLVSKYSAELTMQSNKESSND